MVDLFDTPQGRLTLTSGVPVLTSTVAAATAILYTNYTGNLCPVWSGSVFVPALFTETTQALSDATKSPAAAVAGQVYDMFGWLDGVTFRVTRGPTWAAGATAGSNTVRGSGAGSTALTRVNGILVNVNAITNGPAAGFGTYLGTIATDASGVTTTFNLGTTAAGGGAAVIGLWNAYNRVSLIGQVRDSTASWTYATQSWRPANNSTAARATFVLGLSDEPWKATYTGFATGATSGAAYTGVGLDTTTGATGIQGFIGAPQNSSNPVATATAVNVIGQHFFQMTEYGNTGTATFYGLSNSTGQSGMTVEGRY